MDTFVTENHDLDETIKLLERNKYQNLFKKKSPNTYYRNVVKTTPTKKTPDPDSFTTKLN